MTLIDQIIATIEGWQKHLQPPDHPTASMASMEVAAQALGQRIAQLALSHLLQQCGTGYDRSVRPCHCGSKLRFERFAGRSVRTLMGEVSYTRAYYRCRSRARSCFPLHEQIDQSSREISPLLQRAVALLSAHLPFIQAERVLEKVTATRLTARQIETVAESVGAEAELLQQRQEEVACDQGLVETRGANQPEPKRFIIEMDGVQVGLQDGSWQEAKCGVIYELSQRVEIHPGRWELKRHRCVSRGSAQAFRRRLWGLCVRAGVRQQGRIVVTGDGAEWIDQTAELMFPNALRILDYYHASERVWAVAFARWGEGSGQGRPWAETKLSQLKAGEVSQVIASMRKLKIKGKEGQAVTAAAINYMRARVGQMSYKQCREAGLPIGSGAVESSCEQVVTARRKQAGMRWSEAGVDAVLALRSFVLDQRLDELCPEPAISLDWAKAA